MYVLYLSSLSFILFSLYKFFFSNRNDNVKKLDHKDNYSFIIKNIEFFKNGKLVDFTNYNNSYFKQKNIELNVDFLYDFFVVNYIYNNTEYKYYSDNSFLTFPMYSSKQIKNYVYINKISSAKLLITETDNSEISNSEISNSEISKSEIDILPMIIEFVGPNYNFYKDLELMGHIHNLNDILTYLKFKNDKILDKLDLVNKNYKLIFYDNFNNEYNIDSNNLTWNPELKL